MDEDKFDADKAAEVLAMSPQQHLETAVHKFTSTNIRHGIAETRVRDAQTHLGIATVLLLQQISKQLERPTGAQML